MEVKPVLTSPTSITLLLKPAKVKSELLWDEYTKAEESEDYPYISLELPITYQGGETWSFQMPYDHFFRRFDLAINETILVLHSVTKQPDGTIERQDSQTKCKAKINSIDPRYFFGNMLFFIFEQHADAKFVIVESMEERFVGDDDIMDDDEIEAKQYPENTFFLRYVPEYEHWNFAYQNLPIPDKYREKYHINTVCRNIREFKEEYGYAFLRESIRVDSYTRIRDEPEIHEMIPFMLRSLGFRLSCEASDETFFTQAAFKFIHEKRTACRKTALTLVAIRKFRSQIWCNLNKCPKEIVKMIAQFVWDSRLESYWTRQPKKTPKKKRRTEKRRTE